MKSKLQEYLDEMKGRLENYKIGFAVAQMADDQDANIRPNKFVKILKIIEIQANALEKVGCDQSICKNVTKLSDEFCLSCETQSEVLKILERE